MGKGGMSEPSVQRCVGRRVQDRTKHPLLVQRPWVHGARSEDVRNGPGKARGSPTRVLAAFGVWALLSELGNPGPWSKRDQAAPPLKFRYLCCEVRLGPSNRRVVGIW